MRRVALVVAALLTLAACGDVAVAGTRASRAPGHAGTAAKTVLFKDSFNGRTLDTTKWHVGWFGDGVHPTPPVNGSADNCYAPAQVNVGGGQLTLTATKVTCLGHAWTSGLINTNGHFSFTTGTLKAKVCLPGSGPIADWPAVWSDGQHWPNDGEIDLVEGLHGAGQWHVHSTAGAPGGGHLTAGCHRLKYVRTATSVTFWFDGVKQGSASASSFARSPHYVVLELAVSNSISPPEVPAQLHVLWVTVTSG